MGLYMGIFNFFIVIPQLVAASVLGFLLNTLFGGAPIYALVLGGVSFMLAGLFVLRVPSLMRQRLVNVPSPACGGRTGWGQLQRTPDDFQHRVRLLQHFVVPESQDSKSTRSQITIAMRILRVVAMLTAVDLDDQ